MPAEGKSTKSATIALIDVDKTLIGDYVPDFHGTGELNKDSLTVDMLNPDIISTLTQLGIHDIYLFTDMKFARNNLTERARIVELLEDAGFKVHGVITPADRAWRSRSHPTFTAFADDKALQPRGKEPEALRLLLATNQNYLAVEETIEGDNADNLGVAFAEAESPAGWDVGIGKIQDESTQCRQYLELLATERQLPHLKGEMFRDFLKYKAPKFQRCIVFDDDKRALESVKLIARDARDFPTVTVYVNNYTKLEAGETRKTADDYVSECTGWSTGARYLLNGILLAAQFLFLPHRITEQHPESYKAAFFVRLMSAVVWGIIFGLALFYSSGFYDFISKFIPLDAILGGSFINLFLGITALAIAGQALIRPKQTLEILYLLLFDPGKLALSDAMDFGQKPAPITRISAFRVLNPMIVATITFLVSYIAFGMSVDSCIGLSMIAVVTAILGQRAMQWWRGHQTPPEKANNTLDKRIVNMRSRSRLFRLLFAPNKLFEEYKGFAYFFNIVAWGGILSALGLFPILQNFISTSIPLDLLSQPFGVHIAFGIVGMLFALAGQAVDAIIYERENRNTHARFDAAVEFGQNDPAIAGDHVVQLYETPLGRLGTFIFDLLLHPQNYISARKADRNSMHPVAEGLFRGANAVIWVGLTLLLAYNVLGMFEISGHIGYALLGIGLCAGTGVVLGQLYAARFKAENLPPPSSGQGGAFKGHNGMLPPTAGSAQQGQQQLLGAASRLPGIGSSSYKDRGNELEQASVETGISSQLKTARD